MALAVQTQVSDGSLTQVPLGIQFFAQEDIQVYFNLADDPLVAGVDYTWTASKTITFPTPVPAGTTVFLIRQTQVDEMLNVFDGGAGFTRYTLDENFRQILLLAQEMRDGVGLRGIFLPLDMHGYQIRDLGPATDDSDALNMGQAKVLDAVVQQQFQAADAALQARILGVNPPAGSQFSPISWHSPTIQNSITIPPGVNAWSFGPVVTLAPGATVTIPEGSVWTIANGQSTGQGPLVAQLPGSVDLGVLQ